MTTQELSAIYHELNFWKGFVKTPRFLDGWVSKKKTPELHQTVYDFIRSVPNDFVLDVGSGVVSILNGTVPNIKTVDPLGGLYQFIFDYQKHKIEPPVAYPCEELPYDQEFDIVHISNALDHTQNPYTCFWKLMQAVKYGGYLVIQGFEDEAKFENWQGFHQWNFTLKGDRIFVEKKEGTSIKLNHPEIEIVKAEALKDYFQGKTWFIWICRRS